MTRICLDRKDIKALEREGLGWGHDLDAGCVTVDWALPERRRGIGRVWNAMTRRTRS